MNKIFTFLSLFLALTIFNSCQKGVELGVDQLVNELQSRKAINPGVYVEKGSLVFNDYEALSSFQKKIENMGDEDLVNFEKEAGYKSAFGHRKELLRHANYLQYNKTQAELLEYLIEVSKTGYFNLEDKEFVYPFANYYDAKFLSPEGELIVGNELSRYKGTILTVANSLSGAEEIIEVATPEILGQIEYELPKLPPTRTTLGDEMLKDGQLRTVMQLQKNKNGNNWILNLRFKAYRQYALYQDDRPTYFTWHLLRAKLQNSSGQLILDYYGPVLPFPAASPYRTAPDIYLGHGPTADISPVLFTFGIDPIVNLVEIPDFFSAFMSNFHGSLIYP